MRRAALFVLTLLLLPLPPAATAEPTVIRLAGANRYATAAAISLYHYPSGANTVFVATGIAFPDGLAGAAVAGALDAPLLLTDPDFLPQATADEIARLDPDDIVILGGVTAVSQFVEDALALVAPVTRLAGSNRYLTAVAVSQYGFAGTAPTVVVATGTGFADALAGGPAAVALGGPLLLTEPGALPSAVSAEIARLDPDQIILLGGTSAVGPDVETALEGFAPVTRISGSDRYQTAVEIAELAFPAADRVYVATGLNFPDALAGAAAAAGYGAPILLSATNSVTDTVRAAVAQYGPSELVILGGTAVVGLTAEHRLAYPTLPELADIEIDLVALEGGFDSPLQVIGRPGDARLFVVGRNGDVWSMPAGGGSKTAVLDVSDLINMATESGLLSIAFHPDDPTRMFICYTASGTGTIVVAEYDFPLEAATVTPGAVATVISVLHPNDTRHNGGMVLFGPDGYLYLSLGDGGALGTYHLNAQNPDELRGSILRIDVDTLPYQIPPTNPYADGQEGAPEVWAKGVRNPWRVSWDGDDFYVADVGQSTREELTVLGPDSAGANLGWGILEGTDCYTNGSPLCTVNDFVDPTLEYSTHDSGTCAITGGYVYRGPVAELSGIYFYADYCQGNIRGLRMYKGAVVDSRTFADDPGFVPGFGIDTTGLVYLTEFNTDTVFRIDLAS